MKPIISVLTAVLWVTLLQAQNHDAPAANELWKGKKNAADSGTLLQAFKAGTVHGHLRYYFMHTDNNAHLSDYYANAAGGGIKYETAPYKGFQFGVSGFFVFNVGGSDLTTPDPFTNQANRYEIGLFDIEDPNNRSDMDRLEELYLKYNWKQSHVTFGKQLINTPFINLQDGRMRPTETGGVYAEVNDIKKLKIEGGYLYEISPRSTVRWYKAGESIGLYPQGVNVDGTKADYHENLSSKGIALAGLTYKPVNGFTLKAYDVFTENIFNSALLQAEYNYPILNDAKVISAVQYIRQDALADGGNADASKTYFEKGGKSNVFGAKLGWQNKNWQTSINYNRITAHGRYLFPREWGREPFFTFLPRERNEGLGDVHAYVTKVAYQLPSIPLKTEVGAGYYQLPSVNNYRLNKYAIPSYAQLNVDVHYEFEGFFKGLETQVLYVRKANVEKMPLSDKHIINKVQMNMWNVVLNYHF